MPIFTIEYNERVNNFWSRDIEAETLDQAQDIFLTEIQGQEPDDSDVVDSWFNEEEEEGE